MGSPARAVRGQSAVPGVSLRQALGSAVGVGASTVVMGVLPVLGAGYSTAADLSSAAAPPGLAVAPTGRRRSGERPRPARRRGRLRDGHRSDGGGAVRTDLGALAPHPAPGRAARVPQPLPLGPLHDPGARRLAGGVSLVRDGGAGDDVAALRAAGHADDVPHAGRRGAHGGADLAAQRRPLRDGAGGRLARAGARRLRHPLPAAARAHGPAAGVAGADPGAVAAGSDDLQRPLLPGARGRLPAEARPRAAHPDRRHGRAPHPAHGGRARRRVEQRRPVAGGVRAQAVGAGASTARPWAATRRRSGPR